MRKVFHFLSAFGASLAAYIGVEPDMANDVSSSNEISISENENRIESDPYNFPINEALLNNDDRNAGVVLIANDGSEDSEIIQPKENSAVLSASADIDEDQLELDSAMAAALANAEADSIDTELSASVLEAMDSSEIAIVEEEAGMYEDLEVSGLIMNETRTKMGRDFYDAFFNIWNAQPQINKYYTILIEEKPVRGSVSQITVKVNETEVMQQFVQMRNSEIENMANNAVYRVQRYLANEDEMRNRLLEESDQMGSGIF